MGVLTDGVTKTVKHEKKSKKTDFLELFLASLAPLLVRPVISSSVKGNSGRGIRRAGRGYMDKKF